MNGCSHFEFCYSKKPFLRTSDLLFTLCIVCSHLYKILRPRDASFLYENWNRHLWQKKMAFVSRLQSFILFKNQTDNPTHILLRYFLHTVKGWHGITSKESVAAIERVKVCR